MTSANENICFGVQAAVLLHVEISKQRVFVARRNVRECRLRVIRCHVEMVVQAALKKLSVAVVSINLQRGIATT